MGTNFYTYVHYRPDGTPFYVGKGSNGRIYEFTKSRNRYFKNTVAKYGKENIGIKIFPCVSEDYAFEMEGLIIKALRASGVKLANATDGGEGASGRVYSDETKAKMRATHLGKKMSETAIINMRKAQSNKKLTPEHRAKISRSHIGLKHTDDAKKKISIAKKGTIHTAEHRRKNSAAHKGRIFTSEWKEKISAAHRGRKATAEAREQTLRCFNCRRFAYCDLSQGENMVGICGDNCYLCRECIAQAEGAFK